jgi:FkbM family methyltransferase
MMQSELGSTTFRERIVVSAVKLLHRMGMHKVVLSPSLRSIAKRFFLRQTAYPCTRQIASGLGVGLKMRVLKGTPQSYWMGTHEPHLQSLLRREIQPGITVYDCGANIGYFSLIFAQLAGPAGKVFAFEPSPDSFVCLQESRQLNGFANLVPIHKAVWNRSETVSFVQSETDVSLVSDYVSGCLDKAAPTQDVLNVDAVSLDEFIYEQGNPIPDFVKIDVEGSEGKVVEGARRLLSERRPTLLLEIHGAPGRDVWALLNDLHYQATNIVTGKVPENVDEFAVWIRQYFAVPLTLPSDRAD